MRTHRLLPFLVCTFALILASTASISTPIPQPISSPLPPYKILLRPPANTHFNPIRLKLGYTPNTTSHHLLYKTIYQPPITPTFQKGHGASRIAVCSTGQIRTFTEPLVYENIKKSFGNDTDLFMVLDLRTEYTWQRIKVKKNFTHEELVDALGAVRPVEAVYYDGRVVERMLKEDIERMTSWSEDCFGKLSFHVQEWGKEVCMKMVEEFEKKRGWKYDYVVRARPDMKVDVYKVVGGVSEEVATGTVREAVESNREYQDGEFVRTKIISASKLSAAVSDQFNVIPRRFAGLFFGLFDRVLIRCPLKEDLAHRCPREWKLHDELTCILGTSIISFPGFKGIVDDFDIDGFKVWHKVVRPSG